MRDGVLAVDVGSSSTRAIVFDAALETRGSAQASHALGAHGTQDPLRLHAQTLEAMARAARQARARGVAVRAIAPAAYLHSLVGTDRSGRPVTPVLTWADARAAPQVLRLPGRLRARTGCPRHPSYPVAKIRWLRATDPAAFRKAALFLSAKGFLIRRWTGAAAEDEATASASGLSSLSSAGWDAAACRAAGIFPERLPRVLPCDAAVGTTDAATTRALGLPRPVPVAAGAGDGMLASLGSGATGPRDTALTIGTTFALRRVLPKPRLDAAGALWCYRFPGGRFIAGAASNNGAVVWAWLARLFPDEFPSWGAAARAGGRRFAPVPLLFYPHLLGERTPDWSAAPSGAFVGLRHGFGPRAIAAAVLQGLCFQIRLDLGILEDLAGRSRRIVLSGAGHDPETFPGILASVLGRAVEVPAVREATARGAAILGFSALGMRMDEKPAARRIAPDMRLHKRLSPLYDAYRKGLLALPFLWNALEKSRA